MVSYLAGNRAIGTSAERLGAVALSSTGISTTGLKAYYNFNETSGSTLTNIATTGSGYADGLGSAADGTNNGSTLYVSGKIDYAWDFDGSNDYVQLSNYFNYLHNPNTSGSISVWMLHDANSVLKSVLSTFGNANDVNGIWTGVLGGMIFGLRDDGNAHFATVGDSPAGWIVVENAGNNLATGVWHHLVITKSNQIFKLYVDGVLDATLTNTSTLRSGNSYATPTIGKHSSGAGFEYFNGKLDDLSIWSRELTANEVSTLYSSNILTNLKNGSEFHETDTNKDYVYNSATSAWVLVSG